MPPRRKTTTINGHRRRRKRNAPQYSTVREMNEAKAAKCKAGYEALTVKPHEWKRVFPPDPLKKVLDQLLAYLEKHEAKKKRDR